MGETADQLREQVDQKREQASEKISQLEETVMAGAQQVTQQVKDKLEWRTYVNDNPMMAAGAALLGGLLLGKLMDSGSSNSHQRYSPDAAGTMGGSSASGLGASIRSAATNAGLDDTISKLADNAFRTVTERVREMAVEVYPDLAEHWKGNSSSGSSSSNSGSSSSGSTGSSTSGSGTGASSIGAATQSSASGSAVR